MIQPELVRALEGILNQARTMQPSQESLRTMSDMVNNLTLQASDMPREVRDLVVSCGSCVVAAMFDPHCYDDLIGEARNIYRKLIG
jgi:hypothetical protein